MSCNTHNYTLTEVPNITNTFQDEREHLAGEMSLMYTCEFEGFPLPSIAFYFNGVHITDNDVNIINNTLTIPSPNVSHSGVYQCIISNEFGDDQVAWLLEIRQPSEFYYTLLAISYDLHYFSPTSSAAIQLH